MLSRIVSEQDIRPEKFDKFFYPTPEDNFRVLEERKREIERTRIVEDNKEDPLAAAKQEALRILAEAQDKLKQAEVEAGLTRSKMETALREKLKQEYQARFDTGIREIEQRFTDSLAELTELKDSIYKSSEKELLELVFQVLKKVVGDEVKATPGIIMSMLQKGFAKVKDASRYEIKINPADYEILLANKEKIKEIVRTSGSVKFVKDEGIERGGCRIITESGEISSEPSTQLAVIFNELRHGS